MWAVSPPAELTDVARAVEAGAAGVDVHPVDVDGQLHVLLPSREQHPVHRALAAV